MNDVMTSIDLDIPEYVDDFTRSRPELERLMVKLETQPNPEVMMEAYDQLVHLKRSLEVSTDIAIISVAESIGMLSGILNAMLDANDYVREFSDLVLLVLDRLADLVADVEKGVTLDFGLAQAIHIVLQPLHDKAELDLLKAEVVIALEKLVNPKNIGSAEGEELFDSVDLFGDEENDVSVSTEKPTVHDDLFGLYQETVSFLESVTSLPVGELFQEQSRGQEHSSFFLPLALTLNKMLKSPVSEEDLYQAIIFHDIGERMLPDSIFSSKKLSDLEFKLIKSHPLVSAATVKTFVSEDALEIIEQHHERMDGRGYPNGLKGDEICMGAKIVSLCDAFDAMTQHRPHKPVKRSFLRALAEINACKGSQFDSAIVDAFNLLMLCEDIRKQAPGSRGDKPL